MVQVLTIGIIVLDDVFVIPDPLRPGEKHRARMLTPVVGGNAANAALAIARLGGQPLLIARLGDDAIAETIRAWLARSGIDSRHSRAVPGTTSSRSAIMIEPGGARTIVNYLDPTLPALPDWLPTALPPGISAVLGDTRWEEGAVHMFALARKAGIPAIFDGDRTPKDPGVIDRATHAVFSAEGARECARSDDLRSAVQRIAAGRDTLIAATDGANGVLVADRGAIRHFPAFRIEAIDTLGAGDIWHGAFALALGEGMPLEAAIPFASAAAAIKCTRPGGSSGAPDRAEVTAFLAAHGCNLETLA